MPSQELVFLSIPIITRRYLMQHYCRNKLLICICNTVAYVSSLVNYLTTTPQKSQRYTMLLETYTSKACDKTHALNLLNYCCTRTAVSPYPDQNNMPKKRANIALDSPTQAQAQWVHKTALDSNPKSSAIHTNCI